MYSYFKKNGSASQPSSQTAPLLACILTISTIIEGDGDPSEAESFASTLVELDPETAVQRLCKWMGLRARWRRIELRKVKRKNLPVAWLSSEGDWAILAKMDRDRALIQREDRAEPELIGLDQLEVIWSGLVIEISGKRRGGNRPFDVTWFVPEMLRYRNVAWEILATSFVIELLALLSPLFFQVVMDKVLVHQAMATLDVLATVLVVVSVLEVGLTCLRQYVASQTATRIDARLGAKLFGHLMNLPLSYFKSHSVGVTVMRVRELDTLREFLTSAANTLVIDVAFTGIFFAVMYFYSPFLTAIVAFSIPCYFLLGYLTTPLLQQHIETLSRDGAVNSAFLNETLDGMETVKSLALEPQLTRRWERQTQAFVASNFKVQRLMQLSGNVVQAIQKITLVLVTWFGASMVINLELSIGQLIAFNMMANHVSQPVMRLAELWRNYVQARVSVERLGSVLNTPVERSSEQEELADRPQGAIRIDNVTFRYRPDAPPILEGFSLDIPAGAMVAFVGASGSGKSTIARLIQKLYVPEEGRVFLDGLDIARLDAASLRGQMSVVLQENYLFNRTVRENIALADPALAFEKVVAAAKAAGAHEFILELPEGYDTVLAEGGASLSGGQRQRIAIARAIVSNPAILIFDEATSALDEHSQAIVQDNMQKIRSGRTVIFIAHRLSTVRNCDRIFVIDKGRLVESGNHTELLALGRAYARLWRLQADGLQEVPATAMDYEISGGAPLLPRETATGEV